MELKKLSTKPIFSVGELYSNIYLNIQHRTLMDGTERHPPPIHLQLTQESRFPRSIQLSPSRKVSEQAFYEIIGLSESSTSHPDTGVTRGSSFSSPATVESASAHCPSSSNVLNRDHTTELRTVPPETKVPRISFAIRLRDTFSPHELSKDLFKEWLRTIPALVDEVKVEAGFDSFSSLLIVSVPISLSIYVPRDPAVICLGPITSSNLIRERDVAWIRVSIIFEFPFTEVYLPAADSKCRPRTANQRKKVCLRWDIISMLVWRPCWTRRREMTWLY
jgi:hypothetical protein